MQEQPANNPNESSPSESSPCESDSKNSVGGLKSPTPGQTIADLSVGLAAAEGARFLRKVNKADADTERFQDRMNKALDAQAEDFINRATPRAEEGTLKRPLGVPERRSLKDSQADSGLGSTSKIIDLEDDMAVLTNSPVTITNNHPAPVVPPGLPAWAKVMIWTMGIAALTLVLVLVLVKPTGCSVVNPPSDPPFQEDDGGPLRIEVIPGPNNPNYRG